VRSSTINPARTDIFKRLVLLVIPVYALILVLDKASLTVVVGILGIALFYVLARQYTWVLPLLALPSLTLGHVLYIPITTGWIYEARAGEVLLLVAAAVYFLDLYFSKRLSSIKVDKLTVFLFLYLAASVLSVAYIADFRYFVFGLKIVAYSFLAYFLCLNLINTRQKINWFLYGVTVTLAVLSLQLFYKFYQMGWSTRFIFERNLIHIPIGPIAAAAAVVALLTPLVLAFYLSLDKGNKARPYVLVCSGMGFLAVFLTLGKAAIASLLVALAYIFFRNRQNQAAYILFFLWFVLLAYLFFQPFWEGLLHRLSITFVDVNTEFRITEYETAWQIIQYHPFFGVGSGQQLHYFGRILGLENPQLVNNFFLQSLIDLGAVGLALAISITVLVYRKTRRLLKALNGSTMLGAGFAAAMIVAFLNGLAEVTIFALPYAIMFWALVGVMDNVKITGERQ